MDETMKVEHHIGERSYTNALVEWKSDDSMMFFFSTMCRKSFW